MWFVFIIDQFVRYCKVVFHFNWYPTTLSACVFSLPCGAQYDMEISELIPSSSASIEGVYLWETFHPSKQAGTMLE